MADYTAPLAAHFEEQGVEFMQFAFRWMNCLLMREMSVTCTIRMWDTYLVCLGPRPTHMVLRQAICEQAERLMEKLTHRRKAPTHSRSSIYTSAPLCWSSTLNACGRWTFR